MKILKIDHLGIAVNSIEDGKNLWTDALGLHFEGTETVEEQKVTTAFFPVGESEVELRIRAKGCIMWPFELKILKRHWQN